jgi:hypothetical protein
MRRKAHGAGRKGKTNDMFEAFYPRALGLMPYGVKWHTPQRSKATPQLMP